MDHSGKIIAPEYIDAGDWTGMVRLFVHIARNAHRFADGHNLLKRRLEKLLGKSGHLLKL
jgi:hypothetical protein